MPCLGVYGAYTIIAQPSFSRLSRGRFFEQNKSYHAPDRPLNQRDFAVVFPSTPRRSHCFPDTNAFALRLEAGELSAGKTL